MNNKLRRYEVLLPIRFNDGREVSDELLGEAVNEIVEHFGAVSFESEIVEAAGEAAESPSATTFPASLSTSPISPKIENG